MIKATTLEDIKEAYPISKEVYKGEYGLLEVLQANLDAGPAMTLRTPEGAIGAIVGVCPVWRGVGRVWALTTDELDKYPLSISKVVNSLIYVAVRRYNLHRLEMTVKSGYVKGVRWAKFFGFEAEGLLRNYGPDKSDYLIFGRLF